jgi:hypothetical protein
MARTPQILLCSLPLLATLGGNLLSSWVLEPRGRAAHEAYLVRVRSTQLDLLRELGVEDRRWLLQGMIAELARVREPDPELLAALRACLAGAGEGGACNDALGRSRVLGWGARKQIWWAAGLQIGLKGLTGILFAICGGLLARAAWSRRRLAAGLALLGAVVGMGGVARDIQRAIGSSERSWREGQRDFWITRARVALRLPAGSRNKQLREVARTLGELGADRGATRKLAETVDRCTKGQATCAQILLDLARVYSRWPDPAPRGWLDRWLLWLAGALLLLVPAATIARRS